MFVANAGANHLHRRHGWAAARGAAAGAGDGRLPPEAHPGREAYPAVLLIPDSCVKPRMIITSLVENA